MRPLEEEEANYYIYMYVIEGYKGGVGAYPSAVFAVIAVIRRTFRKGTDASSAMPKNADEGPIDHASDGKWANAGGNA